MRKQLTLRVNGQASEVLIAPNRTLLDVLRTELKLTGSKEGCLIGICGACTVLADGRPIASCLALAAQYEDAEILTIEGLARGDELDPVQQAFVDHSAFQCGYCTAGFIMAVKSLLASNPTADDEEIREYLLGNFCRCGNYVEIMQAVRAAQRAVAQP